MLKTVETLTVHVHSIPKEHCIPQTLYIRYVKTLKAYYRYSNLIVCTRINKTILNSNSRVAMT